MTYEIMSNECKLMHLGKNAANYKTVVTTQEIDLEVTDSSVRMSVECSAAVRKKEGKWNIR